MWTNRLTIDIHRIWTIQFLEYKKINTSIGITDSNTVIKHGNILKNKKYPTLVKILFLLFNRFNLANSMNQVIKSIMINKYGPTVFAKFSNTGVNLANKICILVSTNTNTVSAYSIVIFQKRRRKTTNISKIVIPAIAI